MSEYPVTSERGIAMMSYLPDYYRTSRVMGSIAQAVGSEMDALREALTAVLDQFYVDHSDEWGLAIWETELALSPTGGAPLERQQRIVSKLRGNGTATIVFVKNVAESYDKGQIDVAEDFPHYRVIIRFVGTAGVPSNINDFMAIMREIIPAHLAIDYEYNYFLWDELDARDWTWNQLDGMQISWDNLEVYKDVG